MDPNPFDVLEHRLARLDYLKSASPKKYVEELELYSKYDEKFHPELTLKNTPSEKNTNNEVTYNNKTIKFEGTDYKPRNPDTTDLLDALWRYSVCLK